uniref:Ig-like domain-containing protein n=1 Tax=Poecilia reticulata TaxID=8081 RepID=A0A3P9N025_POERE
WSDVVNLTVSSPPQPVLSVSPSWLNPGASVTLSCEGLEHQPAGWRFFWYKTVTNPPTWCHVPFYSFELLANNPNRTEQNSYAINGPTHRAQYVCRAGRGEPTFFTDYSEPNIVTAAVTAAFSLDPDRVQHFRSDPLSLSCEGNCAKCRVRRFTETDGLSDCSIWGTMTGSTCTIDQYWYGSGVFWCDSGSGEFSNAVNITVQGKICPVHPVTEGDPVTLSCRDKHQNLLSNVFFYHNDKLIQNDSREELNISAVSKSDEGFYKCQHSGKDSPRSWMSVRGLVLHFKLLEKEGNNQFILFSVKNPADCFPVIRSPTQRKHEVTVEWNLLVKVDILSRRILAELFLVLPHLLTAWAILST